MKFFHLSDLHIGLRLLNRDLQEDQTFILQKIAALAEYEQPDAIVIAGDIYDKPVPSAEAVGVFDAFLQELTDTLPDAQIRQIITADAVKPEQKAEALIEAAIHANTHSQDNTSVVLLCYQEKDIKSPCC